AMHDAMTDAGDVLAVEDFPNDPVDELIGALAVVGRGDRLFFLAAVGQCGEKARPGLTDTLDLADDATLGRTRSLVERELDTRRTAVDGEDDARMRFGPAHGQTNMVPAGRFAEDEEAACSARSDRQRLGLNHRRWNEDHLGRPRGRRRRQL